MKLAIIGAGSVGGTLGTAWAQKAGHEIFFGVRDPKSDKVRALLRTSAARRRPARRRKRGGLRRCIVLATPWTAPKRPSAPWATSMARSSSTPPTRWRCGPDGLGLEIGHNTSAGEKVQGWARGAVVFKTLNTTGYGNMADPVFRGVKSVMFVAGDDAAAKPKVIALLTVLGFEVIDAGPLRNARLLEAHAMLWIELALNRGLGRDFAFAIVRR